MKYEGEGRLQSRQYVALVATSILIVLLTTGTLMFPRASASNAPSSQSQAQFESKIVIVKWAYTRGGPITASPSFADIDADKQIEILIGSHDKTLYCLNGTGGVKWTYTTAGAIEFAAGIADIDNDSKMEILSASAGNVYCLNSSGGVKWICGGIGGNRIWSVNGVTYGPTIWIFNGVSKFWFINSTGALVGTYVRSGLQWYDYPNQNRSNGGDLEGDNQTETVTITWDGNLSCSKWTYKPEAGITSNPVVADIDIDGKLEVIIGEANHKVYFLSGLGNVECTFETGGIVQSTAAVLDLDGDNRPEVVIGSYDGKVYSLNVGIPTGLVMLVESAAIIFTVVAVASVLIFYRRRRGQTLGTRIRIVNWRD